MITRRTFSFASLLLAATGVARAEVPEVAQQEVAPAPPAGPFTAAFKVTPSAGKLALEIRLTNTSKKSIDYVATRGSSPGTSVAAWIESGDPTVEAIQLAQVQNDKQRREMMSRMGPMPTFAAVKAGETVLAGAYEFSLPKGAEGEKFKFMAYVDYKEGYQEIEFHYTPGQVG